MARTRRRSRSATDTGALETDSLHRAARLGAIRDRVLKAWDYLDATDSFLVENPNFGPLQGLGGIKKDLLQVAGILNQVEPVNSSPMSLPGIPMDSHPMRLLAAAAQETALAQETIGDERKHSSRLQFTKRRQLHDVQRMLRSCRKRIEQLLQDLPLLAAYGIGSGTTDTGSKGVAPDAVASAAAGSATSSPQTAAAPAASTPAPANAVNPQQYVVNQSAGQPTQSQNAAPAQTNSGQSNARPENTR